MEQVRGRLGLPSSVPHGTEFLTRPAEPAAAPPGPRSPAEAASPAPQGFMIKAGMNTLGENVRHKINLADLPQALNDGQVDKHNIKLVELVCSVDGVVNYLGAPDPDVGGAG